ncbi:unnamed protein product, partial [Bubo scandiacus]
PMEVHWGADVHLQPREDQRPQQGDGRRRLWPHGKPTLEQVPERTCGEGSPHCSRFAGRTCDPVGDPCWSSLFL